MILIADSGSTNTSWVFVNGNEIIKFQTAGINPFFRTSEDILKELENDLPKRIPENIPEICFYGAGIINEDKGNVVKKALQILFPLAKIKTYSDLLAAAHSTLGTKAGISCILGTGSNSCLYDGKKITAHIPPLGFILGDEGSGAVLGKKILADFFKGVMPDTISKKFKTKYNPVYAEILENIYKNEKPNKYLAQFTYFLSENVENEYCHYLVKHSFDEFINRNLMQYPAWNKTKICFVGSVAWYFRNQLKEALEKYNVKPAVIVKEPLQGLVKFYTEIKNK